MKGKKRIFVCFTGIDGSGKTTLARAMTERMNSSGLKYEYVYNRLTPFLLQPFILIGHKLFLRGKDINENYAEYSDTKKRVIRNNPLSHVYQWLLLLDYSIQVFVKVSVPLMRGRNIVCDRYVYDTLATDLAIDFSYSDKNIEQTLKRFFRLFPKPDLTFLVDVPEELACQRKTDVPSIEYLRERRQVYLKIARQYGMTVLDGSKSLAELEAEIESKVWQ